MAINRLQFDKLSSSSLSESFQSLYRREASAIVVTGATYELTTTETLKLLMRLPWIDNLGQYRPDRDTEVGGSHFIPDMPPHIDPHPTLSLKAQLTHEGEAIGRFVSDVDRSLLDETNELTGADYSLLGLSAHDIDEILLRPGDVACFLGSVTLHEFISVGERGAFINSYLPISA